MAVDRTYREQIPKERKEKKRKKEKRPQDALHQQMSCFDMHEMNETDSMMSRLYILNQTLLKCCYGMQEA